MPSVKILAKFDGEFIHVFIIDNNIYVICDGKEIQFVKQDGTWINPYTKEDSGAMEAKHQALLKANVKSLYVLS